MTLSNFQNKTLLFIGLGLENLALINYLRRQKIACRFIVCDQNQPEQFNADQRRLLKLKNIDWRLGADGQDLSGADILFRSPGALLNSPAILAAVKAGAILYSPMRLFFDLCPTPNIIGVTGSKGKGTTASLITAILQQARRQVWLGGNIGVAPFDFLPKLTKASWVVLELSSFQLEDMTVSPRWAIITNFTPEHLAPSNQTNPNFHQSLAIYRAAKVNLIRWQTKADFKIINQKLTGKSWLSGKGQTHYFSESTLPSHLLGAHNRENLAAAVTVAQLIGLKNSTIIRAIKNFQPLPHRLQLVATKKGRQYFDDSFATTPEATITALSALTKPIALIAGGADKGADFAALASAVTKLKITAVALLSGEATPRLRQNLVKANYPAQQIREFTDLKAAVTRASQQLKNGGAVLLSPACASFGMFKNYKERGQKFVAAVK